MPVLPPVTRTTSGCSVFTCTPCLSLQSASAPLDASIRRNDGLIKPLQQLLEYVFHATTMERLGSYSYHLSLSACDNYLLWMLADSDSPGWTSSQSIIRLFMSNTTKSCPRPGPIIFACDGLRNMGKTGSSASIMSVIPRTTSGGTSSKTWLFWIQPQLAKVLGPRRRGSG